VLLVGLLCVGFFGIVLLLSAGVSYSQPAPVLPDHAGLVVQLGDGSVITDCVQITDRGWSTADELLADSALDVDIVTEGGLGTAVCQIEDEGCNTDAAEGDIRDCHCQCIDGDPCLVWHYHEYQSEDGSWARALTFDSFIESGDVVGWAWGEDTTQITQTFTFEQICLAATPTPTNTSTATATDTATPTTTTTPTAEPSATNEPTVTSEPAPAPTTDLAREAPAPRPARDVTPTSSHTPRPTRTPRPTATAVPTQEPTQAPMLPPPTAMPALPPPTATVIPTVPPPTNTLVPTNTPRPTVPPAPTLPPLPTATSTPAPTPTIDQTATMGAILATEMALAPAQVPTDPPTPTLNPIFASPTPDQTAQTLLAQAAPPAPTPLSTAPPAAPAPPTPDAEMVANTATPTSDDSLLTFIRGGLLVALVAMLIVLLARQQLQRHNQHDDPWNDER
jgi:hypothetical protein